MPVAQLLNPAPDWTGDRTEFVTLWHGCTLLAKDHIEANGIDLARCAPDTDFGRGFYTTTLERQARLWAWQQRRKCRDSTAEERRIRLLFCDSVCEDTPERRDSPPLTMGWIS